MDSHGFVETPETVLVGLNQRTDLPLTTAYLRSNWRLMNRTCLESWRADSKTAF